MYRTYFLFPQLWTYCSRPQVQAELRDLGAADHQTPRSLWGKVKNLPPGLTSDHLWDVDMDHLYEICVLGVVLCADLLLCKG